jgi:hypothetical protein
MPVLPVRPGAGSRTITAHDGRFGRRECRWDAEIRVVASDGVWLVAPTLMLHYVTEHAYEPPPEFIAALTAGPFAPS